MWFVLFGQFGECVAEFDTEEEAVAYIEAQADADDYWIGTDEYDYSDYDAECGFDPYMGDYSYDC